MSTEKHLNTDLFGNAVPNPMPAPPEGAHSTGKPESFWNANVQAHVPKYTAVKEGQQHPVGKNNQLKLFHEHVWPHGYTPERLAEVRNAMPPIVNVGKSGYAQGEATRRITDHVARSTIPIKDLDSMDKGNLNFRVGTILPPGTMGAFVNKGTNPAKGLAPGVNLAKKPQLKPDAEETMPTVHGYLKTREGHTIVHEMGHAVDFAENPTRFESEPRTDYTSPLDGTNLTVRARNEGRAEGYRRVHHKATRAMRRSVKTTVLGYEPSGFTNITSRMMYRAEREGAFNTKQGEMQ